eukprot:m.141070 g.141070  ORF g.141070 m.141070 type:complete len:229 (+) comp24135_c1_seq1:388-1074(+)
MESDKENVDSSSLAKFLSSSHEPEEVTVINRRDRISDFASSEKYTQRQIRKLLSKKTRITKSTIVTDDCEDTRVDVQCEATPGMHLERQEDLKFHGIPFFLDRNSTTPPNQEVLEAFAAVLADVASLFPGALKALHIFSDVDGARCAYNQGGAIFCNLRYFLQVHWPKISGNDSSSEARTQAKSFWFVVLCHEFAHNAESGHNADHENLMEQLIANNVPALMKLVAGE